MGDNENKDSVINQKLLEKLVDTNTAILQRMSELENKMQKLESQLSQSQSETTEATPKAPSKKNKKKRRPTRRLKSEFIQSLKDDVSDASENSDVSEFSMITNDDDLEVIKAILKPKFQNQDQMTKEQLAQLTKIQERYRSQIPKLKYTRLQQGSKDEIVTHNYGAWIKKVLKYFTVLSPGLASTVKNYLSTIDVDEFMNSGKIHAKIPTLTEEEYPLITRLSAVNSITDTLSEDFEHLAEDSMTDIFDTLTNIAVICAPNSEEDRTENMTKFWSQRMTAGESVTKFSKRLSEFSKIVNEQYIKPQISQEQLLAVLISGIEKGAESKAYEDGIRTLKFQPGRKNRDVKSTVLWIHRSCDRTKLIGDSNKKTSLDNDEVTGPSAAALRTRGGKSGGRGKGGRGRGRGKGSRGGRNGQSYSNSNNSEGKTIWKDTFYVADGDDGQDVITKPVPQSRSHKPCFNIITYGECSVDECPFNHEFNIVDLRKQKQNKGNNASETTRSNPTTDSDPKGNKSSNVQLDDRNVQDNKIASEDDSDFDYAYDLGFKHSTSFVKLSSNNYTYPTNSNSTNYCNKNSLECLIWLTIMFMIMTVGNYSINNFAHDLMMVITYLFNYLCHLNYVIFTYLVTNLPAVYAYLYVKTFPTNFIIKNLIGNSLMDVKDFIGHMCNVFATKMFGGPPILIYVLIFSIALLIDGRLFKRTQKQCFLSFGVSIRRALYPVILDCGCTFTMSGDKGLFVESSLVKIDEDVGLAESGFSSKATHKGKIVIDGKTLDALYVPDFKQTMISMGQLERMGLHIKTKGNVRSFCTDKGDTYLSFYLAPSNLYPILPTHNSTSNANKSNNNS